MTVPREPGAPGASIHPGIEVQPPANVGARVAAALGALILLLGGAVFSFGAILLAPLGMPIAAAIWRQRRKTLPVVGHWLASLCGAAIVILGFSAVTAAMIPSDAWKNAQKMADSVSRTATQPAARTPAESAGRVAARRAMSSPKAVRVGMAYGLGFAAIFMILTFGTIGWIGGMLAGFAALGHWPGVVVQPSGSYSLRNA
jgi:hypothetical protein